MKKSNFSSRIIQKIFQFLLVFSISWIGSISLSAQDQIPELIQITDIIPQLNEAASSDPNLQLYQVGNSNTVDINRSQNFQYNPQSQVILHQFGYDNSMNMNVLSNNSNGIINMIQNGSNNKLELVGENPNLNLTNIQQGNNNQIRQAILESAEVEMTLIQSGNNHNIEQTINSHNAIEMTIIQKGQNAGIIIKNY